MKITTSWSLALKAKEAFNEVKKADRKALKTVVTKIAGDVIKGSPFQYGTNRRSIKYEIGPGQPVAQKEGQAAIYSTSGYGGYLETGTVKMPAQPYFRPALDKHMKDLPKEIKAGLG